METRAIKRRRQEAEELEKKNKKVKIVHDKRQNIFKVNGEALRKIWLFLNVKEWYCFRAVDKFQVDCFAALKKEHWLHQALWLECTYFFAIQWENANLDCRSGKRRWLMCRTDMHYRNAECDICEQEFCCLLPVNVCKACQAYDQYSTKWKKLIDVIDFKEQVSDEFQRFQGMLVEPACTERRKWWDSLYNRVQSP